jgi:hypothetical protein
MLIDVLVWGVVAIALIALLIYGLSGGWKN